MYHILKILLVQISEVDWGGGRSLSLGSHESDATPGSYVERPGDEAQALWSLTELGVNIAVL